MAMPSECPVEAEDCAVPGRWEGDLMIGKGGASAVRALVERSSSFVLLLHLDNNLGALAVEADIRKAINTLPKGLVRPSTLHQGCEMASHVNFTIGTGVSIHLSDPHSPW